MMTTEEKRQLGQSLSQLSPEDLSKAIQIIAQKNPDFKASGEEVEVDIDAQVCGLMHIHALLLLSIEQTGLFPCT